MADRLTGISSKATGPLLAELTSTFESETGVCVSIESVGGVDAAKRVSSGEPFDLVILATNAIDQLISSALLLPDSKHELVRSSTAIAVREDSVPPRVNTSDALRETIQSCASVGYSTGPSGQAIVRLFETWGITADSLKPRLVQAEPGIPVGRLLADGKVDIGFQQLSELIS
ncbi:MAG: substrate-binding domain-containing protein, partial [Burkholderiaceae bacterium]